MFGSFLPHKITENIYLGTLAQAENPRILEQLQITGLVNASNCKYDESKVDETKIKIFEVNIWDDGNEPIEKYFDESCEFIENHVKTSGKVLIHCMAGVSRSPTLVLAYLMKNHKLTLKDSYLHVKKIRRIIDPNIGFFHKLLKFERDIFGNNSIKTYEEYLDIESDE